jgi:membrane protease YdiL (CAAX protease family)
VIGFILLAISWLLLRIEGKTLGALGFNAPATRLKQLTAGFVVAGATIAIQQLALSAVSGIPWQVNPSASGTTVLRTLRVNVNSVLYEELLFRGYLLYQAIRWLGVRRGVLLGAAAFGVYHWFSFGAFGNPAMMVFIFLFTGAFGLMFAYAFARTKSVAAPIGLHLGWNLVSYLVFSGGPFGPGLLLPGNGSRTIEATGFPDFALDVGIPLTLVVGVCWYLRRRPTHQPGASALPATNAA